MVTKDTLFSMGTLLSSSGFENGALSSECSKFWLKHVRNAAILRLSSKNLYAELWFEKPWLQEICFFRRIAQHGSAASKLWVRWQTVYTQQSTSWGKKCGPTVLSFFLQCFSWKTWNAVLCWYSDTYFPGCVFCHVESIILNPQLSVCAQNVLKLHLMASGQYCSGTQSWKVLVPCHGNKLS